MAAIILVTSCTREIEVKIEDFSPKLVLNSVFYKDSLLRVHLSSSSQVVDSGDVINGGRVFLYDESKSLIEELSFQSGGYYQSSIKIDDGVQYNVNAEYNGLECSVRDSLPLPFQGVSIDTSTRTFVKGVGFFVFSLDLIDDKFVDEYYEISALLKYKEFTYVNGVIIDSIVRRKKVELLSSDSKISSNPENANFKNKFLLSDAYFDGSKLEFGTYDIKNLGSNEEPLSIELEIKKYGSSGYEYFNSLYSHLYYRSIPFALPIEVKGNVVDGYGVFVGARKYSELFIL